MKLRKPCVHDRYDRHWPNLFEAVVCPGGEFLSADALVIEEVGGKLRIYGDPLRLKGLRQAMEVH